MRQSARKTVAAGLLILPVLLAAACAPGLMPPPSERVAAEMGPDMFRAADGTEFRMRSWLPKEKPRAVILALHGFGDYAVAFRTPAALWAERGIATYAYDQRGFGGTPHVFHWAGAETMADDAKAVARALRRRYPDTPLYLLGESMGGSVAIVAATEGKPVDVDGLILVSPAVWEHDFMGSIERSALWLASLTAPGLWLEPPRGLGIHPSDNIEMLRAMGRDSLIHNGARADTTAGLMDIMDRALGDEQRIRLPMLALFGAHEEVLPHQAVAAFLARLPAHNARVAVYPQGYHMLLRDLHGDIAASDVAAWVMNRTDRLPSGLECASFSISAPPCRRKDS